MKTAIIIGATSGIGRELAIRLLEDGWKVGITGRREERLKEIQGKYGEESVSYAIMDVREDSSTKVLDGLLEKTGTPGLFLHVSGIGNQNPGIDEEVEMNLIRTNCDGMVRIVAHFVNYVKGNPVYDRKHKAHIGVVTSVAGTRGLGVSAAYSASKQMQTTYLQGLSQLSRMEKIPVMFSDIRPGFVATDILDPNQHYFFLMTVEKAGNCIIRGLKHRRRIITFDWRYRVLTALWKHIPLCIWERLTIVKTN